MVKVELPNSLIRIGSGILSNTSWWDMLPDSVAYYDNYVIGSEGTFSEQKLVLREGTMLISGGAFHLLKGEYSI